MNEDFFRREPNTGINILLPCYLLLPTKHGRSMPQNKEIIEQVKLGKSDEGTGKDKRGEFGSRV